MKCICLLKQVWWRLAASSLHPTSSSSPCRIVVVFALLLCSHLHIRHRAGLCIGTLAQLSYTTPSTLLLSRCSAVRTAYSITSFVVLAMDACSTPFVPSSSSSLCSGGMLHPTHSRRPLDCCDGLAAKPSQQQNFYHRVVEWTEAAREFARPPGAQNARTYSTSSLFHISEISTLTALVFCFHHGEKERKIWRGINEKN